MKKLFFLPILFSILLTAAHAQKIIPYTIGLDRIASGFSSPVDIANSGDERLFIVERSGRIRILNQDGSINPTPFLNIDSRVINTGGQSERGLLALEFHHDYDNTGWFFVHYSDNNGNTVISRFSIDPNDDNVALIDSEKLIFTLEQPFTNHNGGSIKFGPDNMLYIGMGDGGAANDPNNVSQNGNSLLGKMLRIDVDNGDPYAIPADNPFVNDPDVLDEIWAIGLRNPWKFSFDRVTGDLWIADVGQSQWEEINFEEVGSPGGQNYGWRCREGNHDAITSGCDGLAFTPAAAEYNHDGFTHCSVTGGYTWFVSGNNAPPIYIYTDYCSGTFWGAFRTTPSQVASEQLNRISGNAISTFGEDNNGGLYAAALNNGSVFKLRFDCDMDFELLVSDGNCANGSNGAIIFPDEPYVYDLSDAYRLEIINTVTGEEIENRNSVPPGTYQVTASRFGCSRVFEDVVVGVSPVDIAFDITTLTLSTPESGLSYQWFMDGQIITGANSRTLMINENGFYTVEVTYPDGCVTMSEELLVDNLLSTNTIEQIRSMTVQPNPAEDFLTLSLETENFEAFDLKITDIAGKVFYFQPIEVSGQAQFKIDLQAFPSGVYLLMLSDGHATQTQQIVKQ